MKILIEWKDEYLLGIELIDQQHKHIFDCTNKLYDLISEGKSNEGLCELFSELYFFIEDHFVAEEELMKPDIDQFSGHIIEHEKFKKEISILKTKYEQGELLLIGLETLTFLRDWLITHVIKMDGKLRDYCKN